MASVRASLSFAELTYAVRVLISGLQTVKTNSITHQAFGMSITYSHHLISCLAIGQSLPGVWRQPRVQIFARALRARVWVGLKDVALFPVEYNSQVSQLSHTLRREEGAACETTRVTDDSVSLITTYPGNHHDDDCRRCHETSLSRRGGF